MKRSLLVVVVLCLLVMVTALDTAGINAGKRTESRKKRAKRHLYNAEKGFLKGTAGYKKKGDKIDKKYRKDDGSKYTAEELENKYHNLRRGMWKDLDATNNVQRSAILNKEEKRVRQHAINVLAPTGLHDAPSNKEIMKLTQKYLADPKGMVAEENKKRSNARRAKREKKMEQIARTKQDVQLLKEDLAEKKQRLADGNILSKMAVHMDDDIDQLKERLKPQYEKERVIPAREAVEAKSAELKTLVGNYKRRLARDKTRHDADDERLRVAQETGFYPDYPDK